VNSSTEVKTTRHKIRTFFAWTKKSKINTAVRLENQQAKSSRMLTQDQRLAWINELLTGNADLLPYRVAGALLLLYAQPPTKILALKTTAIDFTAHETQISLAAEPIPVPEPFAGMLLNHLNNRPNLRAGGGAGANQWLFPGHRSGTHLDPQTMLVKLRTMGISVLGARNSALHNLVAEIPPGGGSPATGLQPQLHPAPCASGRPTMVPIRHIAVAADRADDVAR
jgi:hypothetical protein